MSAHDTRTPFDGLEDDDPELEDKSLEQVATEVKTEMAELDGTGYEDGDKVTVTLLSHVTVDEENQGPGTVIALEPELAANLVSAMRARLGAVSID